MMIGRRLSVVLLVIFAGVIKIFSFFPAAVERYYSTGIYPLIAGAQRIFFGWIPFSIGDIFYGLVFIYLLYHALVFIKAMLKTKPRKPLVMQAFRNIGIYLLWVYILFNVLWGLNYNRLSLAKDLDLHLASYTTSELNDISSILVKKLNSIDSASLQHRTELTKKKILFSQSIHSFIESEDQYSLLSYNHYSVKPSLYSYLGNYLGFSGYYNPFSGEAQVNTTVPYFIQPFVTCHEIGHQVGFAKENEANFAAFLATRSSSNPAFRYSVYFDLYSYAINELNGRDSTLAKAVHKGLNEQVKRDYKNVQEFFSKYENPFEPVIRKLYGQYLKANDQPSGLKSYNQVIAMLVAYYKKTGNF